MTATGRACGWNSGTMGVMEGLGFRPLVVERPRSQGRGDRLGARHLRDLPVRRGGLRPRPEAAAPLPQGMGRRARRLEGPAPPRRQLARRRRLPHLRLLRLRAAKAIQACSSGPGMGGVRQYFSDRIRETPRCAWPSWLRQRYRCKPRQRSRKSSDRQAGRPRTRRAPRHRRVPAPRRQGHLQICPAALRPRQSAPNSHRSSDSPCVSSTASPQRQPDPAR